jgi:hypothetical protein
MTPLKIVRGWREEGHQQIEGAGVKGRLVRAVRSARLVLSIILIQRAVAIEIDAGSVAPASNHVDLCLAR